MPRIVSIVEGDGEQAAVPILIRRIAEGLGVFDVHTYATILTTRDRFPRLSSEREIRVGQARLAAGDDGAILVVLDSDGEPPCTNRRHRSSPCVLGVDLLAVVTPLAAGLPIAVVMAESEFESWLVAAAPSLIGPKGLSAGLVAPDNSDLISDAKGWLGQRMMDTPKYSPTADQARFTERFDMAMARQRSPSFARAYHEIERLIRAVSQE